MKLPKFTPSGRLDELRARPDAACIAYTFPIGAFDDYRLTLYASRKALEAFCRDGSRHHALIKEPRAASMITNRNTQRAI